MKAETRQLFQLGRWLSLPIMVLVRLVNGPTVSTDQAIMRNLVFALAVAGIVFSRWLDRKTR